MHVILYRIYSSIDKGVRNLYADNHSPDIDREILPKLGRQSVPKNNRPPGRIQVYTERGQLPIYIFSQQGNYMKSYRGKDWKEKHLALELRAAILRILVLALEF